MGLEHLVNPLRNFVAVLALVAGVLLLAQGQLHGQGRVEGVYQFGFQIIR